MNQIKMNEVEEFVRERIHTFHEDRLKSLSETSLDDLLKKNPYLFRAKYLVTAQDLVTSLLEAKLSASEEQIFGNFLD